jgi:hypothetical protein
LWIVGASAWEVEGVASEKGLKDGVVESGGFSDGWRFETWKVNEGRVGLALTREVVVGDGGGDVGEELFGLASDGLVVDVEAKGVDEGGVVRGDVVGVGIDESGDVEEARATYEEVFHVLTCLAES